MLQLTREDCSSTPEHIQLGVAIQTDKAGTPSPVCVAGVCPYLVWPTVTLTVAFVLYIRSVYMKEVHTLYASSTSILPCLRYQA
jgi:hypothetical protein